MKKMIFPAVLIGAAVGTTIAAAGYVISREHERQNLLLDELEDQPESVFVEDLNSDYEDNSEFEEPNIIISEDELLVEEEIDGVEVEEMLEDIITEESIDAITTDLIEEEIESNPFVLDLSSDAEILKSTFEAIIDGNEDDSELVEESITTQIEIEPQDFTQELTSNDTIDLANFDAATFLIEDDVEELNDIVPEKVEKTYEFDPNSEPTLDDLEKLCESLVERIS